MWIFTKTGMVSVVQHRDFPDLLVVRARDWKHLNEFVVGRTLDIECTPNADYPWRIVAGRTEFQRWLALAVGDCVICPARRDVIC
jgi:hypothetical protein